MSKKEVVILKSNNWGRYDKKVTTTQSIPTLQHSLDDLVIVKFAYSV